MRWWRRWHCPACKARAEKMDLMTYRQYRHFCHGRWWWGREWHNHPDTWGRNP
jgi:hypothetical protein